MVGVYSCSLLYRGIVFEDAVTDENLGPFESDRRSLFTSLVAFKVAVADLLEFGTVFPDPEGGVCRPDKVESLYGDLVASVDFDLILSISNRTLVQLLAHQV
mmetsp:Transcript_10941/g.23677  ORF Transcript_10941/g.23677 Transcript_10941/m.23677 type:complete len:102 (-) Transcript_10941:773-1078(-)